MRKVKGSPSRKFKPIVGEIARTKRPFYARAKFIQVSDGIDSKSLGYAGCLTSGAKGGFFHPDSLSRVLDAELSTLNDGDIVALDPGGTASVLWENGSGQNALFLTEACDCRCLMCPQPPAPLNRLLLERAETTLDLLRDKDVSAICLTGGEPTLLGDKFIRILERCATEHPLAFINVLTNGKSFSNPEFARKVARAASDKTLFCVSLHSDVDTIHDTLVGQKGSYSKTQRGIYNLASTM